MKNNKKETIIPNRKRIVLKNNLIYNIVKWHSLPIVHIDTMIKAGTLNEPLNKAGLADATVYLCSQGTSSKNAFQLAEELDFIGAKLLTFAKEDASFIRLTFLKKYIDNAVNIWKDILLNPIFPIDELERWKFKTIATISQEKADPFLFINKKFKKYIFNNCSYGNYPTESSISNISQKDLIDFYKNYYKPNNAVISIIGDIQYKEAEKIIDELLENWTPSPLNINSIPIIYPPNTFKLLLIDKADLNQAQIRYGYPTIQRNNPFYFPLILLNYIFGGGGFSSRLMSEIRSKKGLTYGIASTFYFLKYSGLFYINTFTKNENVSIMINEIKTQLTLLKKFKVKKSELNTAKSYFYGSFVQKFEKPEKISEQILDTELYDLCEDYLDYYKYNINKVSLSEIEEVIDKFIYTDSSKITILGKTSSFKNELKSFGDIEIQNYNQE